MKVFSAFLEVRRCKNWTHKIMSNYLKTCSASFCLSTECLTSALHPELLLGSIHVQKHMTDSLWRQMGNALGKCPLVVDNALDPII